MSWLRRKAAGRTAIPAPPPVPVTAVTRAQASALLTPLRGATRTFVEDGLRPAVRYATARVPRGATLPPGTSKIGGLPDLPASVPWPTWQPPTGRAARRPLAFFAQVELAPVHAYLDLPLPSDGLLLFFADFDFTGISDGIMGLYADELEGARVVHVPAGGALERAVAPAGAEVLPEAALAALLTWTVPQPDGVTDDANDAVDAILQRLRQQVAAAAPDGFVVRGAHQLGGHADYIQHPVESEVVQAAYDVYRRRDGFDQARWNAVAHKTAEWSVLFQLDSDGTLDLMFGDLGTLWWAAPTADVAAGRWDTARLNFQCS